MRAWRVINDNDVVPRTPPAWPLHYAHFGKVALYADQHDGTHQLCFGLPTEFESAVASFENEAENQQSDGIAAELSNLELQVKSVLNTLAEVTETVKRLNSEVPPVLERMYANASADVAESMRAHASLRKTALQVQKIEHLLAQAMRGPPEELSMKPI